MDRSTQIGSTQDLTTQSPFEVWLAIREKDHEPQMSYSPIRIVRFSGASRGFGIEKRKIEGVTVSVYSKPSERAVG